jgi:hypothetical protein
MGFKRFFKPVFKRVESGRKRNKNFCFSKIKKAWIFSGRPFGNFDI